MKRSAICAALVAGLSISLSSFAQVPASAPAGTTGLCKDGSFSSSATKKGACQGHKGVKTWFGASSTGTTVAANAASAPGVPSVPAAASATGTSANAAPAMGVKTASAAPGGGPGQVWVNTRTKVYHCQGDKVYGKTKQGQYMSEAAAKAAGDHAAQGKTCS